MLLWTLITDEKHITDFSKLCNDTYERITQLTMNRLRNAYEAEEVVQRTYLIAMEKADKVMSHPNPVGWLILTANNLCRQYYDYKKTQVKTLTELSDDFPMHEDENAYDGLFEKITSQLSEKETHLFWSYYIDNIPLRQIAADRGENYASLSKFSYRLKLKLADIITEIQKSNSVEN